MKIRSLILWDMRFQFKYGFYLIYGILTVLYITVLHALPSAWQGKTAVLLIFSDPAAMGLFFMGAILLLEKSQRVLHALAASPVSAAEYIGSKVISLGLLSVLVALLLSLSANVRNLPLVLLGTALASVMFTLLGIIAATKITSLNQFLLVAAPLELVCFVPAILSLFEIGPRVLHFYPPSICIGMMQGSLPYPVLDLALVILAIVLLFWITRRFIVKLWQQTGGARL